MKIRHDLHVFSGVRLYNVQCAMSLYVCAQCILATVIHMQFTNKLIARVLHDHLLIFDFGYPFAIYV